MGEEVNHEANFLTLKFPFLPSPSSATLNSPDRPSPPLQTLASVPFKWEEQPGKPRPCTDIIALPDPGPARIILEPPPCRNRTLLADPNRVTKMPSPTTVLDGPYSLGRPKFSSFRFLRDSFDTTCSESPDHSLLGGQRSRGFFGRGILGISSSTDEGMKKTTTMTRRSGNLSQPTSPRLRATMYERIKHVVVPWKCTKKSNKEGLGSKVDT